MFRLLGFLGLVGAAYLRADSGRPAASDFDNVLPTRSILPEIKAPSIHRALSSMFRPRNSVDRLIDRPHPIAPHDALGSEEEGTLVSPGGKSVSALYIPPYLYPDAFPVEQDVRCHCHAAVLADTAKQDMAWARKVAKSLEIPIDEVIKLAKPKPSDMKFVYCQCGANVTKAGQRVVRMRQVDGSYEQKAFADNVVLKRVSWALDSPAHLAAPFDKLPVESYPLQGPMDRAGNGHLQAYGDYISPSLAKYLDDMHHHELKDCGGDVRRCTEPCKHGDDIFMVNGNLHKHATLVKISGDNATVSFMPAAAMITHSSQICPEDAGCSVFKPCMAKGSKCVEQEGFQNDKLINGYDYRCPAGTVVCHEIHQTVPIYHLEKNDKPCRPA